MISTDFQILETPSSRHSAEKYLGKLTHNLEMSSCLKCLNKANLSLISHSAINKKIQITGPVVPFSLSCDRSSQETLKITLFYQPGRLVKISWKSLDISSNDMSGCRFWLDFQEKFAFNCEKCYSNHCNYRVQAALKRE